MFILEKVKKIQTSTKKTGEHGDLVITHTVAGMIRKCGHTHSINACLPDKVRQRVRENLLDQMGCEL